MSNSDAKLSVIPDFLMNKMLKKMMGKSLKTLLNKEEYENEKQKERLESKKDFFLNLRERLLVSDK